MKQLLVCLLLMMSSGIAFAQNYFPPDTLGYYIDSLGNKHYELRKEIIPDSVYEDSAEVPGVYAFVDTMPSFKKELYGTVASWLKSHFRYDDAMGCATGRVIIKCIIRKDGRVDHVRIVRSVDTFVDKEAVRVVSSMPDWNPGYKDGKPVDVYYVIPVGSASPTTILMNTWMTPSAMGKNYNQAKYRW